MSEVTSFEGFPNPDYRRIVQHIAAGEADDFLEATLEHLDSNGIPDPESNEASQLMMACKISAYGLLARMIDDSVSIAIETIDHEDPLSIHIAGNKEKSTTNPFSAMNSVLVSSITNQLSEFLSDTSNSDIVGKVDRLWEVVALKRGRHAIDFRDQLLEAVNTINTGISSFLYSLPYILEAKGAMVNSYSNSEMASWATRSPAGIEMAMLDLHRFEILGFTVRNNLQGLESRISDRDDEVFVLNPSYFEVNEKTKAVHFVPLQELTVEGLASFTDGDQYSVIVDSFTDSPAEPQIGCPGLVRAGSTAAAIPRLCKLATAIAANNNLWSYPGYLEELGLSRKLIHSSNFFLGK